MAQWFTPPSVKHSKGYDWRKKQMQRREAAKVGRAIAPLLADVKAYQTVEEKRAEDKALDDFLKELTF